MSLDLKETVSCRGREMSKIERYGWSVKDEPGVFMEIDKRMLNIDHEYQRSKISKDKIHQLSSQWSWCGCGCILVAERQDGSFWVFDGQHRVLAAKKRSDITNLPCLVFESYGKTQEAKGFLDANAERKAVSALDKFKAQVMTGDPVAVTVSSVFERLNVSVENNPTSARQLKCVALCLKLCARNESSFEWALKSAIELCGQSPVCNDILLGLYWIENKHSLSKNRRFIDALQKSDKDTVRSSIAKFAAAEGKRGDAVCGNAILNILNRGRRNKFGGQCDD